MKQVCPFLPKIERVWRARDLIIFRQRRDEHFYLASLCYAQSLLNEQKPAQALLQINKSFMANLEEQSILTQWPPGYQAKRWILENGVDEGAFLGNPVRHYQHLASRMSGERKVIRTWRAWASFHLAEKVLPEAPRDEVQIEKENLSIPDLSEVLLGLDAEGWEGEVSVFEAAFAR
jgi:hypothetical protein